MRQQSRAVALVAGLLVVVAWSLPPAAQGGIIVAGNLLVDLDARSLPLGPGPATWTNAGTLGGSFSKEGSPQVTTVAGVRAMTFDGTSPGSYTGPIAPASIVGNSDRTIEVWAFNPTLQDEETLVAWSHRGGPNGTNMAFNYGSNATWGAAGHWGSAGWDMGWSGNPMAGQWHYLVYTYDGTTARVYADGVLKTTLTVALNTHAGDPINVNRQNNAAYGGLKEGSLSIGQVRIHDGLLGLSGIVNNFLEEAAQYGITLAPEPPSPPGGSVIGDWSFNREAGSFVAVANGQALPGGGANSANLQDDTGLNHRGRIYETPHYATYNKAELEVFGYPYIDGYGLRTGGSGVGEGYIYFDGNTDLATNTNFSIWGRFKRMSDIPGSQVEYIFSRPNRYYIGVDTDGTLIVSFAGTGTTQDTGIPIEVGKWYDLGVTFSGVGNDGLTDTIRVYLMGREVSTLVGIANFDTGDWFHIGAGPGGNNDFDGLYDRVIFWNEVVSGMVMWRLSMPEPSSLLLLGVGLPWLARRRRRTPNAA